MLTERNEHLDRLAAALAPEVRQLEVQLAAELGWKRDYAASVKRLIRDGVDAPLGNLFVSAVRAPASGSQGTDRA